MLMFLQLILFEFKGDVHLLHNKQEVELQFCGTEGWVKYIYSGYTALHETHEALHEAHVLQQTDANFMSDEEDVLYSRCLILLSAQLTLSKETPLLADTSKGWFTRYEFVTYIFCTASLRQAYDMT